LYVKGSLKNIENGFAFELKNIIDSTMLIGIGPIAVGDTSYAGGAINLTAGDRTVSGAELSRSNPVSVRMGMSFTVRVSGDPLLAGVQKISLTATTNEIGKIKFDISDTVA
jgi:hypothetical protein